MEKKHVNASYEIIASFKKVKLRVPKVDDKHLKFIAEHQMVNGDKEIVKVPDHFRRGDIFNGIFLTRRFYVHRQLLGQTIVADEVRVVSKIDMIKNQVCLIVDIIKCDLNSLETKYILKCGTPSEAGTSFKIPGTDKYISFLEA